MSNWRASSFKSVFLMVLCPVQSLLCIRYLVKVVQGTNELYIRTEWFQEGRSPRVKMCKVYSSLLVAGRENEKMLQGNRNSVPFSPGIRLFQPPRDKHFIRKRAVAYISMHTHSFLHICLKINYCCCSGSNIFI